MDHDDIIEIAAAYNFSLIRHSDEHKFYRFKRPDVMLDIWYTTGTIGIYYPHEEGRYFRNFDMEESSLNVLFKNPRDVK